MLPRGTARGGHSLGALYAEATGGGGFDNAHDAMADARALTTVWRWISAVEAMGSAAVGALTERPELLGRVLILVGLAEGIAIYGLIVSILILNRLA